MQHGVDRQESIRGKHEGQTLEQQKLLVFVFTWPRCGSPAAGHREGLGMSAENLGQSAEAQGIHWEEGNKGRETLQEFVSSSEP